MGSRWKNDLHNNHDSQLTGDTNFAKLRAQSKKLLLKKLINAS